MDYAVDDLVFSVVNQNSINGLTKVTDGGFVKSDNIYNPKQIKTSRGLAVWTTKFRSFKEQADHVADDLEAMQAKQEPVQITDSAGKNHGRWVIKTINQDHSQARLQQIDFTITFEESRGKNETTALAW